MQTTFILWSWLDCYCTQQIRTALSAPIPETWIGRLAKHVHTLILTRGASRELRPAEFGLEGLDAVYAFKQRKSLDLDIPQELVVAVVIDIIARWLQFPTTGQSRPRGWFVDSIVHACGPNILFLDSVWFAFRNLSTEVFGDPSTKITTPAAYRPLAAALAAYPLEPLIYPGYESLRQPTLFQAAVHGRRDFLLPFRECAPSRARSRLPGNCFDPVHARTLGGLFSGLLFRGVFFATPFGLQATTYFPNPDAWNVECAKYPSQPVDFFCNIRAYSSAKCNRGVHLVPCFWEVINSPSCANWEKNTCKGAYDFTECYKFLTASNPTRFREIGGLIGFLLTADFAYAGAVSLPTVDTVGKIIRDINKGGVKGLARLGLIPQPEAAKKGFKKSDVTVVKGGFSRLYRFLDVKLSDASKKRMVFDAIMVENGLCKLTRWDSLKLITL
ncbi:hypothetical protein DFH07DRAFT_729133 [Mycena maculata]|uniref:Uncharacterized protein n=1 Tax=Mycena maculata TaxID=230809 RepID=A0AAD7K8J0_9AGAR|nr:hypothetical protein DFH07DRAFT_729133 [Mycena maculata]